MVDRLKKRPSLRPANPYSPVRPNNPHSPMHTLTNTVFPAVPAANTFSWPGAYRSNAALSSDKIDADGSEDEGSRCWDSEGWGSEGCPNCGEHPSCEEEEGKEESEAEETDGAGEATDFDEDFFDEDEGDDDEVDEEKAANDVNEAHDGESTTSGPTAETKPSPKPTTMSKSKSPAGRSPSADRESPLPTGVATGPDGATPTPNQRRARRPSTQARRGLLKYMKKRESLKPRRVWVTDEETNEAESPTKENAAIKEKTDTAPTEPTSDDAAHIKAAVAGITITGNRIKTRAPTPAAAGGAGGTASLSSQACLDLLTSRKRPAPDNEEANKRARTDMSAEDMASRIIVLERELVGLRGALADCLEAQAEETLGVLNRLREENKRFGGE